MPQSDPHPFVFRSRLIHDARMNRYGVVFIGLRQADPAEQSAVFREARQAGCRLQPSGQRDVGILWVPPAFNF